MQLIDSRNTFSKTLWLCNPSSIFLWKVILLRMESFMKNKISQHYPLIGWAFANLLTMVFPDCTARFRPGGQGIPSYGLCGKAQRERGTFFTIKVYKTVGISLVEVYERVGKSVISVCKSCQKGYRMYFMAVKKSQKRSGFVMYSYFEDSALTAVESVAKFLIRYVRWVPFVNRRYIRGVPFRSKIVYKRVMGLTSGQSLPVKNFFECFLQVPWYIFLTSFWTWIWKDSSSLADMKSSWHKP